MSPFFNLREIPDDLHAKVKSESALAGLTMNEWILKAIEEKLVKEELSERSQVGK